MAAINQSLSLPAEQASAPTSVGRYVLHREIARGGMATIHIARLMGAEGFSRIVAAKRLHPEFTEDADFVEMFLDEARIASRVYHRNVVPVLDVVAAGEEVMLVQEYVHGVPLAWLTRSRSGPQVHLPISVAVSIACQVLAGLEATHNAVDELGQPMHIVHRDVSPQNVMVAVDGTARLLDFGVAKAAMAAHLTGEGTYKGKLAYSAPEQLRGAATPQSDVFALSVVLWELLAGKRLHDKKSSVELVHAVLNDPPPSIQQALRDSGRWDTLSSSDHLQLLSLEPIVRAGLASSTAERWATVADMELALTRVLRPATTSEVAVWLREHGRRFLERREAILSAEELSWQRRQAPDPSERVSIGQRESLVKVRARRDSEPTMSPVVAPIDTRRKAAKAAVIALFLAVALAAATLWPGANAGLEATPAGATSVQPAASRAGVASPAALAASSALPVPAATGLQLEPPRLLEVAEPAGARSGSALGADTAAAARLDEVAMAERELVLSPRRVASRRYPPRAARVAEAVREAEVEPRADCSTPYYYLGAKKIFREECL